MSKPFKISERIESFENAWKGISVLIKTQHNAQLHLVSTILVILMGFVCRLSYTEWSLVLLSILMVWICEALNTALEFLADAAIPEFHPLIGKAKDVAAGAVLISSIGAIILGFILFFPKIYAFF